MKSFLTIGLLSFGTLLHAQKSRWQIGILQGYNLAVIKSTAPIIESNTNARDLSTGISAQYRMYKRFSIVGNVALESRKFNRYSWSDTNANGTIDFRNSISDFTFITSNFFGKLNFGNKKTKFGIAAGPALFFYSKNASRNMDSWSVYLSSGGPSGFSVNRDNQLSFGFASSISASRNIISRLNATIEIRNTQTSLKGRIGNVKYNTSSIGGFFTLLYQI